MNKYIETSRLILRDWKEEDIPVFARLNSDERVMEFFLNKLTYQETLDFYTRIRAEFTTRGYGLYAVEKKGCLCLPGICRQETGPQRCIFLHLSPQQTLGTGDAEDRDGEGKRIQSSIGVARASFAEARAL